MRNTPTRHRRPPLRAALLAALLLPGVLAPPAAADDRDLLGASGLEPYVFIIFDVSGSMNWQPGGDFFAPADGDDPGSKFYQAKSALYEVLTDPALSRVHWGFATYNQDRLQAYRKHWMYTPVDPIVWPNPFPALPYPAAGEAKTFGDSCMDTRDSGTGCNLDSDNVFGSCNSARDLGNLEQYGELVSFPVMAQSGFGSGVVESQEWVTYQGHRYRFRWTDIDGNYGDDQIEVELRLRESASSCFFWISNEVTQQVTFRRLYEQEPDTPEHPGRPLSGPTDFLIWQQDVHTDINGNPAGFLEPPDTLADGTCNGWEGNDDTNVDLAFADVNMKYATTADPDGRGTAFDRGDVIPLDWKDSSVWGVSNRDAILKRLAPNIGLTCPPSQPGCLPSGDPDFRVARYFEDFPTGGVYYSTQLRLLPSFADTPPLVPNGSTPIGNSMLDLLTWYDQWKQVASHPLDGSPPGDPYFSCRPVYLLILTDGDETCYSDDDGDGDPATGTTDRDGDANPCWLAGRLLSENDRHIKTYVVGFGVQGADANFLNCISDKGGTGVGAGGPGPILPQNKDELVRALQDILVDIRSEAATFASAAVPSIQVGVDDKIFLSSFRPVPTLDDELRNGNPVPSPVWDGHVDAFLRPLPLDPDGRPDESIPCSESVTSGCHLWDAGEVMLTQAPTANEVQAGTLKVGMGADQRRIYYPQQPGSSVPLVRRLFQPQVDLADKFDLWTGFGIPFDPDVPDTLIEAGNRSLATIGFTLRQKQTQIETESGPLDITWVLGDVFHSNPVFQGSPEQVTYWTADLEGNGKACDNKEDPNRGYRCFYLRHQFRRKMLLAGANDGAMHAFDAGVFHGSVGPGGVVEGEFDNGTGKELFAYIPRPVLPKLLELKETPSGQEWTVDGTARVDDVFIDPKHSGSPDEALREWRTVATGGLREGGPAYYALDITQPDDLDADFIPQPVNGYVPSCAAEDGSRPASCGRVAFPAPLWEFTDLRDEDANGHPDLGDAWSTPNTGRIRVCKDDCDPLSPGNDIEDRYVAVFGGGLDPAYRDKADTAPDSGDWLYMVDIETGATLYKRHLVGSAASEPAAVDTNLDGYLDRVYIGTTAGYVYKVDLAGPGVLGDVSLPGGGTETRVTDTAWEPFQIFRSVGDDSRGRPIFFPPSVIFVARLGQFALAFGTGDREDLWDPTPQEGRFYMILDTNFRAGDGGLPLTETSFQEVPSQGNEGGGIDYLLNPNEGLLPGWFMRLEPDERLIAKTFALSGITAFTSFQPTLDSGNGTCGKQGTSRIFVVFTGSANSVIKEDGTDTRFWTVDDFVTDPYTELSTTKNVEGQGGGGDDTELTADLEAIRKTLMSMFPSNCEFANYNINLKTLRSDTGVFFIAPVPVCLIEKNWKEL